MISVVSSLNYGETIAYTGAPSEPDDDDTSEVPLRLDSSIDLSPPLASMLGVISLSGDVD